MTDSGEKFNDVLIMWSTPNSHVSDNALDIVGFFISLDYLDNEAEIDKMSAESSEELGISVIALPWYREIPLHTYAPPSKLVSLGGILQWILKTKNQ